MQHFVQCYIRSVLITQNYHPYGVAHEDDVDATLIEQTRGGIIVRRERGNFFAAPLHFAKIFHCACSQDQLPISERKLWQKAPQRRTPKRKRLKRGYYLGHVLECGSAVLLLDFPKNYHVSA
jgi:hypothetical protein